MRERRFCFSGQFYKTSPVSISWDAVYIGGPFLIIFSSQLILLFICNNILNINHVVILFLNGKVQCRVLCTHLDIMCEMWPASSLRLVR